MTKKGMKFIVIILILLAYFALFSSECYATDVLGHPDYWTKLSTDSESKEFQEIIKNATSVIRVLGIIVSVATLAALGIKFMMGSAEEKAQYKQTILPWLIGAIMVFAMATLPELIYNIVKDLF